MAQSHPAPHERHHPSGRLRGVGIAFLALGVLALIVPVFATTTAVILLATAMLLWGGLGAVMSSSLSFPDWKITTIGFIGVAISGLMFLVFPTLGARVLTMLIVVTLLIEGIYSVLVSFTLRERHAGWVWMSGSGALALIVGFVILLGWPDTAHWVLGLGLGLNFASTGLALIRLGGGIRPDRTN